MPEALAPIYNLRIIGDWQTPRSIHEFLSHVQDFSNMQTFGRSVTLERRIFHTLIEFLLNGDELKECGTHTKNAFDIPKMFQVRVLHQSHQGRLEDGLELRLQNETATTHPFVRVSTSVNFFLALEDFDEGGDSGIETCGEF
ncbi:hypothetical protein B0H13DRAFT_1893936 [Mycena leptocephala]|nr:hypothetical protein B0H13DRAFT_1893936 [Mycena leptocephala]